MLAKCVAEIGHCTAVLRALQNAQLPQVSKSSLLLKELMIVVCSICSLRFMILLTMGLEQCLCFRALCAHHCVCLLLFGQYVISTCMG